MLKNIATALIVFMTIVSVSTASVDVVCLLLWHHEDEEQAHHSDTFPGHHPNAPDSHLHGVDFDEPIVVAAISFIVDDGISSKMTSEDIPLFDRGNLVMRTEQRDDPSRHRPERPPQTLS